MPHTDKPRNVDLLTMTFYCAFPDR